jgi:peptide/nickel transport system permease protein
VVITAAQKHDYTVVQGAVLLIALIYVLVNLFVDVFYSYLDPRIRRGRI